MLLINEKLQIPLREFKFRFARSSGPGGQNVNKLNTKATLIWAIAGSQSISASHKTRFFASYGRRISTDGVLQIQSQGFRDQGRNVADCLEKLRAMLQGTFLPAKPRKATKPRKAAIERRLREKSRQADKKRARKKPTRSE